MKSKFENIKERHLNSDELLRYHRHLLSKEDEKLIGLHLKDCELCSDALKGVSEMKDAMGIYNIVHELRKKIVKRYTPKKTILYRFELITILIAFFIIGLILFLGYYFIILSSH